MATFHHNDVELYYELYGNGPPLLLIAGLASDSQSWLPVLSALTSHYTLVLLDNRGVGRSSQDCPISIELMADDCVALLRHLGFGQVNLLGHSMGGMVAFEVALRYPALVERLLLVATTACNSARNNLLFSDWADRYEYLQERAAWFRSVFSWILTEQFFEHKQLLDGALYYLLAYPWPQSTTAFRRQTEAIAGFDARDCLELIRARTCVIAGAQDILLPLYCSEELANRIPGAELTVIKGAAHSIHTEQPELFVQHCLDFLKR